MSHLWGRLGGHQEQWLSSHRAVSEYEVPVLAGKALQKEHASLSRQQGREIPAGIDGRGQRGLRHPGLGLGLQGTSGQGGWNLIARQENTKLAQWG